MKVFQNKITLGWEKERRKDSESSGGEALTAHGCGRAIRRATVDQRG